MNNTQYSTVNKNINNSTVSNTVQYLLSKYSPLINHGYEKWFERKFTQLPEATIHTLAEQAAKGQEPKKYFVWLLNRT